MNEKTAAQIQNILNDPALAKAMMATGALTGLAGGALTAAGKKDPTESRGSRRWRIIRNALLSGGAGAGAVGLGVGGYKSIANALPANDVDPVRQVVEGVPARGLLAGLGIGTAHHVGGTVAGREGEVRSKLHKFLPGAEGAGATLSEEAAERGLGSIDDELKTVMRNGGTRMTKFKANAFGAGVGPKALAEDLVRGGINPSGNAMGAARVWGNRLFGRAYGSQIASPLMRTVLGGSAFFAPEIISGAGKLLAPKEQPAS